MTRFLTRTVPRAALFVLAVTAVAACDRGGLRMTDAAAGAPSLTPQAVVTLAGTTASVTLSAGATGELRRIASFTGRLRFDATKLAYESAVDLGDDALRAANPIGATLRVAGASKTGFEPTTLAQFRFRVIDPAGLESLEFILDEVHDIARADLAGIVRRAGSPRIVR